MLVTDWTPPGSRALGRLADSRVSQYWDRHHVLATHMLQDARDPQPKPACCGMDGNLWDLVAMYPPGVQWTDRLPVARVFDGPILKAQPAIPRGLGLQAGGARPYRPR